MPEDVMAEGTSKPLSKNLTASELLRIKQTSLSRETEKKVGEDWLFWQETFQLCRDVPTLLDEIIKIREENLELRKLNEGLYKELDSLRNKTGDLGADGPTVLGELTRLQNENTKLHAKVNNLGEERKDLVRRLAENTPKRTVTEKKLGPGFWEVKDDNG